MYHVQRWRAEDEEEELQEVREDQQEDDKLLISLSFFLDSWCFHETKQIKRDGCKSMAQIHKDVVCS